MLNALTQLVQNEDTDSLPEAICGFLSKETLSNVTLFDLNMRKIAWAGYESDNPYMEKFFSVIDISKENFGTNSYVIPLKNQGDYIASLVLYKEDIFSKAHVDLIKIASLVLSVAMLHMKDKKTTVVKLAISTLSYSELEAVLTLFEEFDGYETLIVASKIADKNKISRSVIVNALRKLESAGIIESRSLGVKGTYIKIINIHLLDELKKFRN